MRHAGRRGGAFRLPPDHAHHPARLLQDVERLVDILLRVRGGHRRADAARSGRHGGGEHGQHEEPPLLRELGHHQRALVLAADDRHDGGLALERVEPPGLEAVDEEAHVAPQLLDPPRLLLDHLQRRLRGRDLRRGERRREDERARAVLEVHHRVAVRGDVAADARDRLAQRAHLDVDRPRHPEMLLDAVTGLPQDAERVRLVHHQKRPVLRAEAAHLGEVDDVAVHAEDGVRHHQLPRPRGGLGEAPVEVRHVVVFAADEMGPGEDAAVHDARVVELVRDDHVAAADERGDGCEVRHVPAREDDRVLGAGEGGDLLLELPVEGERAGEDADAVRPRAVAVDRGLRGGVDFRVPDEAEVAVRREEEHLAAACEDSGAVDVLHGLEVEVESHLAAPLNPGLELGDLVGDGVHQASFRTGVSWITTAQYT